MDEHLKNVRDMIQIQMDNAKSYYDNAEGFVAKVKLFIMLNKRTIAILAATHFALLMLGYAIG